MQMIYFPQSYGNVCPAALCKCFRSFDLYSIHRRNAGESLVGRMSELLDNQVDTQN